MKQLASFWRETQRGGTRFGTSLLKDKRGYQIAEAPNIGQRRPTYETLGEAADSFLERYYESGTSSPIKAANYDVYAAIKGSSIYDSPITIHLPGRDE